MDELKKLLAEAQTDEPWSVVWYGDEHLPAIAIHRTAEDRICFMPTIQHPADGVQFEANAALIVAAVNALPELLERVSRYESALQAIADNAAIDTDAPLFRAQAAGHARAALNQEPGTTEVFQELAKKQEPLGAEFEAAIGDRSTLYET